MDLRRARPASLPQSDARARASVVKRMMSTMASMFVTVSGRGAREGATRGRRGTMTTETTTKVTTTRVSGNMRRAGVKTRADASEGPPRAQPNPNQMLVLVPPHPLLKHWLAVARNVQTPPPIFRAAMAEIGRILIYECGRDWLQTFEAQVQGPLAIADVEYVNPEKPVCVVPILRAGLTLLEESASVLPSSVTYHLGYVRDEETLQPKLYLNKLPKQFAEDSQILVSDPMLATGGTIVAAIDEMVSRGASPKNIRIICVVASPVALTQLSERYPGLRVYAAMIDEVLNDDGYIVPGLGDAGDRAFGTM